MRRNLYKDRISSNFEEELAEGIILVAREFGWKVEYVLGMTPQCFFVVSGVLRKFYEKQEQATKTQTMKGKTFRGR